MEALETPAPMDPLQPDLPSPADPAGALEAQAAQAGPNPEAGVILAHVQQLQEQHLEVLQLFQD